MKLLLLLNIVLFAATNLLPQTYTVTINTEPNASVYARNSDNVIVDSLIADGTGSGVFNLVTSIGDIDIIPSSFEMSENYPNPFSKQTNVDLLIDQPGKLSARWYDAIGRQVGENYELDISSAGSHRILMSPGNVAPGVYFYRIEFNGRTYTGKAAFLGGGISQLKYNGIAGSFNNRIDKVTAGDTFTFIALKQGKAAVNKSVFIDGEMIVDIPLVDGITVHGIARGVNSVTGDPIYPLSGATVTLEGAVVTSASDGRYWVGVPNPSGLDRMLKITHPDHHDRTEMVDTGADTTMNTNIAFAVEEDLEFFDYLYQRPPPPYEVPLRRPDPARGDTLTVFHGEPDVEPNEVTELYAQIIPLVMANDVPYSNGNNYFMEFTEDSANAFCQIRYNKNLGSNGAVYYDFVQYDNTQIMNMFVEFNPLVPPDSSRQYSTAIKELFNLFDGRDFWTGDVPERFKESKYYTGPGYDPQPIVPMIDKEATTIAAKIAKENIIYHQNVE